MRGNLSTKLMGLSLSAILAVACLIILTSSLLLVGLGTTQSLQAALLGIGWRTVVGFEIGLLGAVITGFFLAVVFVITYYSILRLVINGSKTAALPREYTRQSTHSWPVRVLFACFLFPLLAFLVLRMLALVDQPGVAHGAPAASSQGSGALTQPANIGPIINSAFREAEPSFTADGRTMYFNCSNADICVSHLTGTWEEGNWTPPERIGAPISTEYEEIEPVINSSGDMLYFTSIRPGGVLKNIPFLSPFINVIEVVNRIATASLGQTFLGGLGLDDVWVSYRVNGAWSEPQNLNDVPGEPPINTAFADHCLFFSADGNEAFWTSTRPGGYGDDDIWTSRRVNGKWTEPENLGPNINGPGSEHTSIPTPDGKSLYITSNRPGGFGGDDIYVSARGADGMWGRLANLESLINGPGDDRCPAWTPDLKIFLYDSVRAGGSGGRDIWWVYFKDVQGYPKS